MKLLFTNQAILFFSIPAAEASTTLFFKLNILVTVSSSLALFVSKRSN